MQTTFKINLNNYGRYSSENYGAHSLKVEVGSLTLWFSYNTVVAIRDATRNAVCENVWGSTTGKHLNWIDGGNKSGRLPYDQFHALLEEVLEEHHLQV